jgi:GT2 family glycosyltransferase
MITHNRQELAREAIARLPRLPEQPSVIVVDNASEPPVDASLRACAGAPVLVVRLGRNVGAAARTVGVRAATTPYVAFCDDDSGWEAGALSLAADQLDADPRLALVAARLLVGRDGCADPVAEDMRRAPLGHGPAGPLVMGFLACAAVLRRGPYLAAGGFHPRFLVGGEEALLAWDLVTAGWRLAYAGDVVARHWPATGQRHARTRVQARNEYWTAWLRRPLTSALRASVVEAHRAIRGGRERSRALVDAIGGLGWVASTRQVVPARVEAAIEALDRERRTARARP